MIFSIFSTIFFCFLSFGSYLLLETDPKGSFFGDSYTFKLGDSKWEQITPPKDHSSLKAVYKSPSGDTSLTLRESSVKKGISLRKHVKSWIKDYRKYGLLLIDSKPLKVNGQKGFLINSEHKESKKSFRQMVFLKNNMSVTMTCKSETGSEEIVECAKLIKNFAWNKSEDSI